MVQQKKIDEYLSLGYTDCPELVKELATNNKHRLGPKYKKSNIYIRRCLKKGCEASLYEFQGKFFGGVLSHECVKIKYTRRRKCRKEKVYKRFIA